MVSELCLECFWGSSYDSTAVFVSLFGVCFFVRRTDGRTGGRAGGRTGGRAVGRPCIERTRTPPLVPP